jgi:hypothetical protein
MAKHRGGEGCMVLGADKEHPIYSKLCPDGRLEQQGISCDGFQREVGVERHTEGTPRGHKFCWDLHLYQHPGIRQVIPLGCSREGSKEAPKEAKLMARAWHKLAEAGYDPREIGHGGVPRGRLWHQVMLPALYGAIYSDRPEALRHVRQRLRDHGLWESASPPADATEGLGRSRRW